MKKDWNTVEILKHSRHDWLNKIQLIKGNIALERLDRVKEIIEEIVIETQNETKLTNLQLPSLAAFLMTYNWEQHKFTIEFEVLGELINLSEYDQSLTEWCEQFFSLLEKHVDANGENHLFVSVELFEEETRFLFDFSGIIENTEVITQSLKKKTLKNIELIDCSVHTHELTVSVRLVK
ncbi:Spo0B C-terminal domain-containing protein [Litchfieldia alkalitelluris]|uniref:Spo0B C-terminal domain-containing protein n=1 Tax=Litchfieldia alkalitelluris TaxID=304268 RepID=UPI00099605FA|nr:Spo0B C-terminal domain-containing protein [Litchfieldia alkalitelluris]